MCIPKGLKLTDIMAQVKHVIKNGIVNLKQAVSGRKTGINVSLYEYVDEEDKPQDEYIFNNKGSKSLTFNADGSNVETVEIESKYGHEGSYTNTPFSCTNHPNWITVQTTNTSISVTATNNDSYTTRSGSIILTQNISEKEITINVSQYANEIPEDNYVFETDDSYISSNHNSYSGRIDLTSTKNGAHQGWSITSNPDSWVTLTEHVDNDYIEVSFTDNSASESSTNSRNTSARLTQDESFKTLDITFHQDGETYIAPSDPVYEFSAMDFGKFTDVGGQKTVTVVSTKDGSDWPWSIITNTSESWVTVTKEDKQLKAVVTENESYEERSTYVIITQQDSNEALTVNITQDGKVQPEEPQYEFDVQPNRVHHDETAGGGMSVTVTSTKDFQPIDWTTFREPAEWVHYTTKSNEITISVDSNEADSADTNSRTSDIVLAQNESGKHATIVVSQDGDTYVRPEDVFVFSASNESVSIDAIDGHTNVDITSTKNRSDIGWTVESETTVNGITAERYNKQLKITGVNNTEEREKSASFTLKQEESNDTLTINVTQKPAEHVPEYKFEATPTDITLKAKDTLSSIISVTSTRDGDDINWSVEDGYDAWLTVTPQLSSHSLNITASVNNQFESRDTVVTIKQESTNTMIQINVTQEAAEKTQPPVLNSEMQWQNGGDVWTVEINKQGIFTGGNTNTIISRTQKGPTWDTDELSQTSGNGSINFTGSSGVKSGNIQWNATNVAADGYNHNFLVTLTASGFEGLDEYEVQNNAGLTLTIANARNKTVSMVINVK